MGAGDYVLPVDKPEGPTSHDVVAMARRALGTRKIGHTGTLDPFASGVLVLCVGRATRLAEYLTGLDKSYVAEARLGVSTDTLDRDGEVVAESQAWGELTPDAIGAALAGFVGDIHQVPPQFSAKKVEGEAMHRKARRGERVALEPVSVTIHDIELMDVELPAVTFRLHCSTGTYVRAIARDLGEALGVGAHLTRLRRTRVGGFDLGGAVPASELEDAELVAARQVDPVDALRHLERIDVDASHAERIRHGQRVRVAVGAGVVGGEGHPAGLPPNEAALVAVVHDDRLVAVARFVDGVVKPAKVFPA